MSTRAQNAILRGSEIVVLGLLVSGCGGGGDAAEGPAAFEEEMMLYFPWPPPRSSALVRIPSDYFIQANGGSSLGSVATKLERALEQAGYRELQFYAIPGDSVPSGFALVTPLEQINEDASPKVEPDRWIPTSTSPRMTSLWEYITTAIRGNPGQYRVIVFLTTSRAVRQDSAGVTKSTAAAWQSGGWNSPPDWLWNVPYTSAHRTTALIYEFAQTSIGSEPSIRPSRVRGSAHLYRAGIWPALGD
jgi:hypothetical protein